MQSILLAVEEVVPVAIFFAIAAIVVISNRISKVKKAKTKSDDTTATAVEKSTSADSEHDEILRKRMEKQKGKNVKNVYAGRHETSATKEEKTTETQVKMPHEKASQKKVSKKEKINEDTHTHPVQSAPAKKEVRQSSAGSLGEVHDEGCYEHDDVRYVLEEVQTADSDADAGLKELQRVMVWSEILDKPKFKKK